MYNQKGFSILELMIGLLISLILVILVATITTSIINQAKIQIDHTKVQKDSKFSSIALSKEIIDAGNGLFLENKFICPYGLLANTPSGSTLLNIYPIYFSQDTSTSSAGITSDKVQITSFYTNNIAAPYRMMNSISNLNQDIELNKVDFLSVGDKLLIGNSNQKIPCMLITITQIDSASNKISFSSPSTTGQPFTFNYKEDSFIYLVADSNKDYLQSWVYFLDINNHKLKYYNQLKTTSSSAHTLIDNVYLLSAFYNYDISYHTYNSAESVWYKKENGPKLLDNIPYNTAVASLTNYDRRKIKGFKFFILKKGDKKNTDCNLMNKDIPLLKTSDIASSITTIDVSQLVSDWKCWNFSLLQGENVLMNGVMNE